MYQQQRFHPKNSQNKFVKRDGGPISPLERLLLDGFEKFPLICSQSAISDIIGRFGEYLALLKQAREIAKKIRIYTKLFGLNILNENRCVYLAGYFLLYTKTHCKGLYRHKNFSFTEIIAERENKVFFATVLSLIGKFFEMRLSTKDITNTLILSEEERRKACQLELFVCEALVFDFNIDLPHTHLKKLSFLLNSVYSSETKETVLKVAFSFCNDATENFFCSFYPAMLVALSCLVLACKYRMVEQKKFSVKKINRRLVEGSGSLIRIELVEDIAYLITCCYDDTDKTVSKRDLLDRGIVNFLFM